MSAKRHPTGRNLLCSCQYLAVCWLELVAQCLPRVLEMESTARWRVFVYRLSLQQVGMMVSRGGYSNRLEYFREWWFDWTGFMNNPDYIETLIQTTVIPFSIPEENDVTARDTGFLMRSCLLAKSSFPLLWPTILSHRSQFQYIAPNLPRPFEEEKGEKKKALNKLGKPDELKVWTRAPPVQGNSRSDGHCWLLVLTVVVVVHNKIDYLLLTTYAELMALLYTSPWEIRPSPGADAAESSNCWKATVVWGCSWEYEERFKIHKSLPNTQNRKLTKSPSLNPNVLSLCH